AGGGRRAGVKRSAAGGPGEERLDARDVGRHVDRHAAPALDDPNRVKVVLDRAGFALYVSRATIPHRRDGAAAPVWQHVGLYAYRRAFLARYVALPPTPLELAEALEQLRALEHGYRIRAAIVEGWRSVPVDVPADVARVEALLARSAGR
ncbi:MAG TPA: hypothetical protein VNE71_07240, partial [Myxococcota bacterium]|nr:hypothetical protein [Myxococcota bacterium]